MTAEHLDHAGAHHAGDVGDLLDGERHHRQQQVLPGATVPTAGRQPAEQHAEHQRQQRGDHEIGHRDPRQRSTHHHVIRRRVAPDGRDHPQRHTDQQRGQNRPHPQLQTGREALADQLADIEVLVLEGRTEIALHQIAQIAQILHRQWLIQVIGRAQVLLDFRGQAALAIEGAARGDPHQEERQGDHDQQGGNRLQQPFEGVAQHPVLRPGRCPGVSLLLVTVVCQCEVSSCR